MASAKPMHQQNRRRAIVPVTAGLLAVLFWLSTVERPSVRQPTGYPQLVSIQDLPQPDWCQPEPVMPDSNLFGAFGFSAVHAGSQASGETGIVTRPPIRSIWDKDPIYAVAVDTRYDKV